MKTEASSRTSVLRGAMIWKGRKRMSSNSDRAVSPAGGRINPFTGYDIFGYLIPGATLLACILLTEGELRRWASSLAEPLATYTPLLSTIDAVQAPRGLKGGALGGALVALWVGVSYIVGHLVASVSAFAIDRGIVAKGSGYPSQRLIFPDQDDRNVVRQAFWRTAFVFVNLAALSGYLEWFWGGRMPDWAIWFTARFRWASLGAVGLALVLHVVASILRERKCVCSIRFDQWCACVLRIGTMPYRAIAWLSGQFVHTREHFDPEFCLGFRKKFARVFGIEAKYGDTNLYWLPVIHLRRTEPQLSSTLDGWLNLYSFSRNLAAALWLASLYSALSVALQPEVGSHVPLEDSVVLRVLPGALFCCAFVVLFRYYYLYADYYTRYLLRAFFYACPPADSAAENGEEMGEG